MDRSEWLGLFYGRFIPGIGGFCCTGPWDYTEDGL